MNELVNMEMAKDMPNPQCRLIQSALGQKAEAKPWGLAPRERSQGRSAMGGHEVACLPGKMGSPMGQNQERVSIQRAKFGLSALNATGRAAAHAVSGALVSLALPAVTSCAQFVCSTDEVPRRLLPPGGVSPGYKSQTKGQGDASETGTAFPRPRLKGCQQRQSRGLRLRLAASACSERQNLRVPPEPLRFTGPVSPVDKATKWPGGTSSSQSTVLLSNSPQQPRPGQTAVRSR